MLLLLSLLACPRRAEVPASPAHPDDPPWRAMTVPLGVYGGLVLTCTTDGGECPVPECTEEGCPESPALIVGMANLAEGPVSIPVSRGAIAWDRSEPGCDNVVTTAEGDGARTWEPGRTIVAMPATAVAGAVPEGLAVDAVLGVDLDGDGADEWIVSGEAETGEVTGLVRDGTWTVLVEDVRPEAPEDATEQERFDAEIRAFDGELLGLTDVGLDGALELVVSGEGYESVGYEVVAVGEGGVTSLGKAGCAH